MILELGGGTRRRRRREREREAGSYIIQFLQVFLVSARKYRGTKNSRAATEVAERILNF